MPPDAHESLNIHKKAVNRLIVNNVEATCSWRDRSGRNWSCSYEPGDRRSIGLLAGAYKLKAFTYT